MRDTALGGLVGGPAADGLCQRQAHAHVSHGDGVGVTRGVRVRDRVMIKREVRVTLHEDIAGGLFGGPAPDGLCQRQAHAHVSHAWGWG